jgi:membrane protease YdiL (CAAX protease family)
MAYLNNTPSEIPSNLDFLYTFATDVFGVFIILYVIYRRNRNIKDLGFTFELNDILRGFVLLLVSELSCEGLIRIFEKLGIAYFNPQNVGMFSNEISILYILVILINPWYEELLRSYLITEVKFITNSKVISVIIAVILQGSYHIYQGWFAMFMVMISFLFYSIYYSKTNKIIPVIIAHGVSNIMVIFTYAHF